MRAWPFVLAGAVVVIACAPRDRAIRLERLHAERRNLEATLDHLEDRLITNSARVRFWREMQERHESVAAIACASQDRHAQEMAAHDLPVEPPRSSFNRSRVAAADRAAIERAPAAASPRAN